MQYRNALNGFFRGKNALDVFCDLSDSPRADKWLSKIDGETARRTRKFFFFSLSTYQFGLCCRFYNISIVKEIPSALHVCR